MCTHTRTHTLARVSVSNNSPTHTHAYIQPLKHTLSLVCPVTHPTHVKQYTHTAPSTHSFACTRHTSYHSLHTHFARAHTTNSASLRLFPHSLLVPEQKFWRVLALRFLRPKTLRPRRLRREVLPKLCL